VKYRYFFISIFLLIVFIPSELFSQGLNHVWIHGATGIDTNVTHKRGRMLFELASDSVVGENSKMAFTGTQASISDANGNFLFVSNGCWIMDASGDTMLNGNDINPGLYRDDWDSPSTGLPLPNGCLILPYPGDSSKYVMFHQTGDYSNFNVMTSKLSYSVIDMNLNGGLGGVIPSQKNLVAFYESLSVGLAACKQANGRDWWILAEKDSTNLIYKVLFTPNGIESITTQTVNMTLPFHGNATQPSFSPDGNKFAYKAGRTGATAYHEVRIFSFDRCTGVLDSIGRKRKNGEFGFGLAFSPDSRYLYYSSGGIIYQLDTDAPVIAGSDTTVAVYDGYYYPTVGNYTNFWLMYLAANGKIYITSSAFTIDLHVINTPDSAGIACDVQQHSFRLPCYSVRGGIYHPNYYLGALTGSGCDTLGLTVPEMNHHFNFRVYPNPVNTNQITIGYQLLNSHVGTFEIFDITGKLLFKLPLPPWSNEQKIDLPSLNSGIYNGVMTSGTVKANKKIVVIK
jgi:hypothetical protein